MICVLLIASAFALDKNSKSIRPHAGNLWYWEYNGKPVLLRGGSNDDNPYQWEENKLVVELDLLASVGGNYIRNTMSDRDDGNVYAFKAVEENTYDLNQWNDEYWNRFTFFLKETRKRVIIVQLTLWDQFDLGGSLWRNHPWIFIPQLTEMSRMNWRFKKVC